MVADMVERPYGDLGALTDLVSAIAQAHGATEPVGKESHDSEAHRAWLLAWLTACTDLRSELDERMADAAFKAALAGASYGEIGAAVGTSRQAARKRWPDLPVPARRLLTDFEQRRTAERSSRRGPTPTDEETTMLKLDASCVALGVDADDWRAAVEAGGRLLVDAGAVEERYVDAMLRTVEELGPYAVIAPGVAIPHARPEDGAMQVGLSLALLSEPVEFGSAANDPVDLVFAFATTDPDAHLELLRALADFIENQQNLDALRRAKTVQNVVEVVERSNRERNNGNA